MNSTCKSMCGALVFAITISLSSLAFASGNESATPSLSDMAGKVKGKAAMGDAQGVMDKININTASLDALKSIPGLDPKIGEAIAAYREANGAFKSISDLLSIDGINASLLNKIKPFLSL